MSITQVKENIINLLESIIRRSEMIEKQSGRRNLVDIDIAMEDIRLLYREMDRLRKYTEADMDSSFLKEPQEKPVGMRKESIPPSKPQPEPSAPDDHPAGHKPEDDEEETGLGEIPHIHREEPAEKEEPVEDSDPVAPGITTITEDKPVKEVPEKEEIQPEKEKEKEKKDEVRSTTVASETKEPASIVPPASRRDSNGNGSAKPADPPRQLVGEMYSAGKSSIHERLAQIRDDKSIGARMQQKPVANIKEAIGINEKFLFINELFSGDLKAYNDAVQQLNNCSSIQEAFELLNRYTEDFQWDGQRSAETIEKFANIVQRRYM